MNIKSIKLQSIHKHNPTPLTYFSDKSPSTGDVNRKEYIILIHQSYITVSKMYHSSCKYNMYIMVRVLLKYSWIKFKDRPTVHSVCYMHTNIQPNIKVYRPEVPKVSDLSLKQVGGFKCMDKLCFTQVMSICWYIQMTTKTVHGINNIKFTYRFVC